MHTCKTTVENNMNHKALIVRGMSFLLAAIFLAGCASPTPAATPAPCPTSAPLACPTGLAQLPPKPNDYRIGFSNDYTNVVITFDPGDKCSMDIRKAVNDPTWSYEIVVNDDNYQNYVVTAFSVDEGKTLKDIEDYNKTDTTNTPPSWSQLKTIDIVEPLSNSFHGVTITGRPVYFVCFVQGPAGQRAIGEFGPVKVIE
jgi:hypothetical protein